MIRYFFLAPFLLAATTNAPTTNSAVAPANNPAPAPVVREVSPGIFDYNGIRLDKKKHQITFPASVNQRVGLIEYLLVNDKGKTHESLFATKIIPHDIHVAMLLIGLPQGANPNQNATVPPSAIDSGYLQAEPKLEGPPVLVSVTWNQDGKEKKIAAEDWILNLQTNHKMSRGSWTYNGSLVENGAFLADGELSIIAVITDPTALVNNPRKGYDNDEIWQVRDDVVPPLDTPVAITLTLVEASGNGKP